MKVVLAALIILVVQPCSEALAAASGAANPSRPVKNAGEVHLELGLFTLFGETDLQIAYRPPDSRWIFGYRYSRIENDYELFGMPTDEDIRTLQGPNLRYLFGGSGGTGFYAEAGLYQFSYELICKIVPGSDKSTRTQVNLGGGFLFDISESLKINLGVTISTQAGEPLDAGACLDTNGERGDDASVSIVYFF